MEEGEIDETEAPSTKYDDRKERRQRKKMLINDVMSQLEFYFSAVNLRKDLFMQELLAKSPYIDLDIFKRFNKLKSLTTDTGIFRKAIRKSTLLELSEDETGVRRSTPLEQKENEEECTIYVENLPPLVSHEWVRKVFEQYGVIDYVSLPCFKSTGNSKGFAFIEYHTAAEAQQAIGAFEGVSSFDQGINPADLLSIKTYGQEDYGRPLSSRKNPYDSDSQSSHGAKRSYTEAFQNEETFANSQKEEEENPAKSSKKNKKKKRKRNKKEKQYENSSFLRVMSKRQWKSLRNKYLDTQRKNMAQLKTINHNLASYNSNFYPPDEASTNVSKTISSKPEFSPGLIVKMVLDEPPDNPAAFRTAIQTAHLFVAYIDIESRNVFIRFKSSETAEDFVYRNPQEDVRVLGGKEESDYWDRIIFSWEQKRIEKTKKKPVLDPKQIQNVKGRHKIIQRALKLTEDPAAAHRAMFSHE